MPPAVLDEGFGGSMGGAGDCTWDGIENGGEEEPQPVGELGLESGDELWLLVSSRGML